MPRVTDQDLLKLLSEVFGNDYNQEYPNYHLGFHTDAEVIQDGPFALVGGARTDDFYKVPLNLDRLREGINRLTGIRLTR